MRLLGGGQAFRSLSGLSKLTFMGMLKLPSVSFTKPCKLYNFYPVIKYNLNMKYVWPSNSKEETFD